MAHGRGWGRRGGIEGMDECMDGEERKDGWKGDRRWKMGWIGRGEGWMGLD